MGKQEITIDNYTLADCNGNLRKLQNEWSGVPKVSKSLVETSKGHAAQALQDCLSSTKEVSSALQELLSNSTRFFEGMGVSFEESDRKAAENTNQIVRC